jgi:transposase
MAYSQDLRDRVIDAVVVEGMSRRGAAARFGVSETAAINWVKRVQATGSRTPAQLGGYKPMLLAPHQAFLEAVRRDKPDITLQGLSARAADSADWGGAARPPRAVYGQQKRCLGLPRGPTRLAPLTP